MRNKLFGLSTAVLLVLAAQYATAQVKPDFSGTWVSTGSFRHALTIRHDGSRLIVEETSSRRNPVFTYLLDGSESRNETRSAADEKWTHVSRARWVSNALVITTTTTRENLGSWEHMTMYYLEPETGNLKITKLDAVLNPGPVMGLDTITYKKQ